MVALETAPQVGDERVLEGEDLTALPDALAEEEFIEVQRAYERIQIERLAHLGDLERRRIHERQGYLLITAWLVGTFTMGWGAAKALVSQARALTAMPLVHRALVSEAIATGALELLVRAQEIDLRAFARDEAVLVGAAQRHTIAELHRVLGHWRQLAEAERYPDPGARQQARRALHASVTFDGMVRVDGDLSPEVGEGFLVALHAVLDAQAHGG